MPITTSNVTRTSQPQHKPANKSSVAALGEECTDPSAYLLLDLTTKQKE